MNCQQLRTDSDFAPHSVILQFTRPLSPHTTEALYIPPRPSPSYLCYPPGMSLLSIVAKQITRQATLQPRLALPAGRTVSVEEGRRLAKLVNDEEERISSNATQLLDAGGAESPVVLEEGVSKRILLLRQRQNHDANVKAAVAHAKRRQQTRKAITPAEGERVQAMARQVLHREKGSDHGKAVKARKARASSRKDTTAAKKAKKH